MIFSLVLFLSPSTGPTSPGTSPLQRSDGAPQAQPRSLSLDGDREPQVCAGHCCVPLVHPEHCRAVTPRCLPGQGTAVQVEPDGDSGDKQKGLATKGPASSRLLFPTTSTTRAAN